MRVAYSLAVNHERDLKRFSTLKHTIPCEVCFMNKHILEDINLLDIVDPIIEHDVELVALKAPKLSFPEDTWLLEKLLVISDELNVHAILLPFRPDILEETRILEEYFNLFASYKRFLVIEADPQVVTSLRDRMLEYLGGVFKISIRYQKNVKNEDFVNIVENCFGLLSFIKIVNCDEEGKLVKISEPGKLNFPLLVQKLVFRGYDGFIVLDYETRGLRLPLEDVIKEYEFMSEYIRSIREKVER